MKTFAALTLALIAGFAPTPSVAAPENSAAFAKRVAEYATTDLEKPKALCHCHDRYDTTGIVFLESVGTTVNVTCKVPTFDYRTGESFDDYVTCAVEWTTFGR